MYILLFSLHPKGLPLLKWGQALHLTDILFQFSIETRLVDKSTYYQWPDR